MVSSRLIPWLLAVGMILVMVAMALVAPRVPVMEMVGMGGTSVNHRKLIGERITVQVPASRVAGGVAFWADVAGAPLLVVLDRDRRTSLQRSGGASSVHAIVVDDDGSSMVTLTGVVEALPRGEEMFSWRLTGSERAALATDPVYLRVEAVTEPG